MSTGSTAWLGAALLVAAVALAGGLAISAAPAYERGRQAADDALAGAQVTLVRGACYGTCPVYGVQVGADGSVEFEGQHHVCAEGVRHAQVDPARARELIAFLQASGFASWPSYVREDSTDAPSAVVVLQTRGGQHHVSHYFGMNDVPPAVSAVENRVDQVAGTAQWLPYQRGNDSFCRSPDGSERRVVR